jgi:eukaryotic-like serine/threonine-protein kinase
MGRFDMSTKKWLPIVARPPYRVWEPDISLNGKWLAFLVRPTEASGKIVIARLNGARQIPETDWIPVSENGSEDKPRWSADGRIVYFTSERDGFRCIWGQRVDPATGRSAGAQFAAHHSHRTRRSLKDMNLATLGIAVTGKEIFFSQIESTGNVWMMKPVQP